MQGVNNGGTDMCGVGEEVYGNSLHFLCNFSVNLKLL